MKLWSKVLIFVVLNAACFYSLRWYNDTRQTRIVSALLPSVVKVSPIGEIWSEKLILGPRGLDIIKVYQGFGVTGHGSGVFVTKDGLIVTCAHVVDGTPLAEIDLNGYKTLAYVVGRDVKHDVAVLRPCKPLKGIRPVSIGTSVVKGLPVFTIGFPGPFHKYVTAGIISGSMNTDIFSDVVIAPGNSGGGVFTVNGDLVGLARAMTGPFPLPTYQGFSVLTALDAIREIVEKYSA